MKLVNTKFRAILAGFVALGAAGALAPIAVQAVSVPLLNGLKKGQWVLKFRDGSPSRKICVRSGQELIQIEHRQSGCSSYVVEDGAHSVTVQYTCRGNGYGRTSVRKETGGLAQVRSQGIAGGVPFQLSAEARYVGACS